MFIIKAPAGFPAGKLAKQIADKLAKNTPVEITNGVGEVYVKFLGDDDRVKRAHEALNAASFKASEKLLKLAGVSFEFIAVPKGGIQLPQGEQP